MPSQRARLAQSVARGSHNPKVVSSILAPRTFRGPRETAYPRWGSNPQPPAPGTDALPLRHAGLQKWVMVMLGLEPRTFALSERRSTD